MAGRPRKPTALHIVQGTDRPSRINPAEPTPEAGPPPMPEDLCEVARAKWAELIVDVGKLGTLHETDRDMLAGACRLYAELIQAEEAIVAEGAYVGSEDRRFKHPAVAVKLDCLRLWKQYLGEFGLSPASRGKVSSAKKKKAPSGWDDV